MADVHQCDAANPQLCIAYLRRTRERSIRFSRCRGNGGKQDLCLLITGIGQGRFVIPRCLRFLTALYELEIKNITVPFDWPDPVSREEQRLIVPEELEGIKLTDLTLPARSRRQKYTSHPGPAVRRALELQTGFGYPIFPFHLQILRLTEIHTYNSPVSYEPQPTPWPPELFIHRALSDLTVTKCTFPAFPASLGLLASLTTLRLDNCSRLDSFPPEIGQLSHLTTLTIRECPLLTSFPREMEQLSSLTVLDVDVVFPSMEFARYVEKLTVRHLDNELHTGNGQVLPAYLAHPCLEELSITQCHDLTGFAEDFLGRAPNLADLTTSWSGAFVLPTSVNQLARIDITHAGHRVCDIDFGGYRALEDLEIDQSDLEDLPASLGRVATLRKLKLSRCPNLTALPDNVDAWTHLEELKVETISLARLPDLSCLAALRKLRLFRTEIADLPAFTGLDALEEVNVDWAPLHALPPDIGALRNLKKLILNNTDITTVPGSISFCSKLAELDLNSNSNLRSLPADIGQLTDSLRTLSIRGTPRLRKLPDSIIALPFMHSPSYPIGRRKKLNELQYETARKPEKYGANGPRFASQLRKAELWPNAYWTPASHTWSPKPLRQAIWLILLCLQRVGVPLQFNEDILNMIFAFFTHTDFPHPALGN